MLFDFFYMMREFFYLNSLKKSFYFLFSVLLLSMTACDDNFLDFSRLESADVSGCWGIPVADVQYSIEDMLNKMEENDYLFVDADDVINLKYVMELEKLVTADQYLTFAGADIHGSTLVPLPELPDISDIPGFDISDILDTLPAITFSHNFTFSLENEYVVLKGAAIDSAILNIDLAFNLPVSGSVTISTSEILRPDNTPFVWTFSVNDDTGTQTLDLSGCSIYTPNTDEIAFDLSAEVSLLDYNFQPNLSIDIDLSLSEISLRELEGYLAAFSLPFEQSVDFDLNLNGLGGSIEVFEPQLILSSQNSFGIEGLCNMQVAALTGANHPAASFIPAATTITIPASNAFFEQEVNLNSSIHIYPDYNKIELSGEAIINPQGFESGMIHIDKNSSISLKAEVIIPFKVDFNHFSFVDTLNMNWNALPNIDELQDITLRIAFENGLPFDLSGQLYFCDENYQIVDSAFSTPELLSACYWETPTICKPVFVTVSDMEELNRLIACPYMIFGAKVDSDSQVSVQTSQTLRARISAKTNLNLITQK